MPRYTVYMRGYGAVFAVADDESREWEKPIATFDNEADAKQHAYEMYLSHQGYYTFHVKEEVTP